MNKRLIALLSAFFLSLFLTTTQSQVRAEGLIAEEGRIVVDGATTTWNKNLYAPIGGCLKFLVTFTNSSQDSRLYFEATVLDKYGVQISAGINTYYNLGLGMSQQRELQICQYQTSNAPFVMRISNYFSDARRQTFTEAPFKLIDISADNATGEVVVSKKKTITCQKGKTSKTVTGTNPKCPTGYKKK